MMDLYTVRGSAPLPPRGRRGSAVLTLLLAGLLGACTNYGESAKFGQLEVFYQAPVTAETAQALGTYLTSAGWAGEQEKTVQLLRGETWEFRMVATPEAIAEEDGLHIFGELGADLSRDVFNGEAVTVHLCNEKLETVKVVTPPSLVAVGPIEVRYTGTITRAEATDLADFFRDAWGEALEGETILRVGREDGQVDLFVAVNEGAESDQEVLDGFAYLASELANGIFANDTLATHLTDNDGKILNSFQ